MRTIKRLHPDVVEFRSLGITMSGKEAYSTVRSNNGSIGFRRDIIRTDNK